jgi:hypothetical protein
MITIIKDYVYIVCKMCQNVPLCCAFLSYIYLGYFVCLCVIVCVCHNNGTLCYSFSFGNQTDHGDETEGMEIEILEMGR